MAKALGPIFYNSSDGVCSNPPVSSISPFAVSAVFNRYAHGAVLSFELDGCIQKPILTGTFIETIDLSGVLPLFLSSVGIRYDYPALVLETPTIAHIVAEGVSNGATVQFSWYQYITPAIPPPPTEDIWWLTIRGFPTSLWTSTNPLTWPNGPYTRTPNVVPFFGPMQTGGSVLIIDDTDGSYEYILDYDPTDGVNTTLLSITNATIRDPRSIDNVVFAADTSDQYYLSLDFGQTWTSYLSPGGSFNDMLDLARLDSGRWICVTYGSPRQAFYTDALIPNTGWIPSGDPGAGERIISSGTSAICWRSGAPQYGRTVTGASWALINPGFTPNTEYGVYYNGVYICSGPTGYIARSEDDGITWDLVLFNALSIIGWMAAGGGYVLVGDDNTALFVSADLGLTWTQSTLPVLGVPRASIVATPI